tara:strand:+ start:267 stop:497 length:231 start_codon:yes stop_codon:yes gene_type:complete
MITRKRRKASGISSELLHMKMINYMIVLKMCRCAADVLKADKKEDEAFYFEQIADWLQIGKKVPLEPKEMQKALGI